MIDIQKLSKEEREFVTGIINRLDSGDVKNVGAELLAEFVSALTPEVFQQGYRLGDVLCQGGRAEAFNEALARGEQISIAYDLCGIRPVAGRQENLDHKSGDRRPVVAKFNQDQDSTPD